MYKALIADIDGTLVPIKGDGSEIGKDMVDAVSGALRRGAQISVATGRGWTSTKPVVQKIGIEDLCIVEGGSCIIDPTSEEIVWQITIDAQTSSAVVEVFKQLATQGELIKSSTVPERVLALEAGAYDFQNRIIYLLGTDQATAIKVKEAVDAIPTAAANITTPSWASDNLFDVHVTNKDGTKEHALNEWFRRMDITKAETIAMGDSANDLPLFEVVGLKVAVGNATDELKRAADYIAPSRSDGALTDVINKFLR
jgi:Cof subfamily protein (haloacid dehalogenase superfamily)